METSFKKICRVCFVLVFSFSSACGGGGAESSNNQPTNASNSAPVASNVNITNTNGGEASIGDTLMGNYDYADSENNLEGTSTFRWLRGGSPVAGATSSTYQITTADAGQEITFEVTPVATTGNLRGQAEVSSTVSIESIVVSGALPSTERYLTSNQYDCAGVMSGVSIERRPGLAPLNCVLDPDCNQRLVVGHRGADAFAPENTLASARAAILLGLDILEVDVRMTDDDRIVVIHDSSLERTTNIDSMGFVPGDNTRDPFVFRRSLADIQGYAIEADPEDPDGDWSCLNVPTLEELLEVTRDKITVLIEVKDTSRERAPSVALAVAKFLDSHPEYDGQVIVSCDIEPSSDNGGVIPSECDTIRSAYPGTPILIRVLRDSSTGLLVAEDVNRYSPPLLIQAVTSMLTSDIRYQVNNAGAKLYYSTESLSLDAQVLETGDTSLFLQAFDLGAQMLLSNDNHHLVLQALERLAPNAKDFTQKKSIFNRKAFSRESSFN